MTGMLASVNSLDEALQALSANVDIIDLKQPALGALGALTTDEVKNIVIGIDRRRPVSATVGDLQTSPEIIYQAVKAMAETGVDYIKIGFFPGADWQGSIESLSVLAQQDIALIAVLFADTRPDFSVITLLKKAGFKGIMLDTLNKTSGSLTQVMAKTDIERFVKQVKEQQLICGLAGSLRLEDVVELMPYRPDYLGFRGALCQEYNRTAQLNKWSVIQIKRAIEHCGYHQNPLPVQHETTVNKRILIADDNEINRLLLANMLELNGYTVDSAINGAEALQFINKNQYKMAFIDLSMPVMSGLEMIKILRKERNTLKVAAISAYTDDHKITEALGAGFDYSLSKPVDEDYLVALINLH